MRLDVYLATHWPEKSRSTWQKLCRSGYVFINGQAANDPGILLGEDDAVTVSPPKKPDFSNHDLPVIYQDDDVLVINKPAGTLTHAKGELNDEFSVGEFMRTRSSDQPHSNRPGIVHRLDRQTSGVMITAKTVEAKVALQKEFANRKVKKTYIALVLGRPKHSTATIDLPILRNPKQPQTFKVSANGRTAQTTYKTLKNYKDYTLLELMPLTGRTHQLRVHLAHIGCPIVGDIVYGKKPPKGLDRTFLHAAQLELTLPSRQRKVFKVPLPDELNDFLAKLDQNG